MDKLFFYKGKEVNLPINRYNNNIYITSDTHKGYLGKDRLWATNKELDDEINRSTSFDDSIIAYINNKYDEGDEIIMPLFRNATNYWSLEAESSNNLLNTYIYANNKPYINKNINRIKLMICTTGRVRVSIFNKKVWDANPKEETCVVYDLVNDIVTSTGYHEWDLPNDIIIKSDEWVGGWYNKNYARFSYSSNVTILTSPSGWSSRNSVSPAINVNELNLNSSGYLNIGLYKRGAGRDTTYFPILENATSLSSATSTYIDESIWLPKNQNILYGKKIYRLYMSIAKVGYLNIVLIKVNQQKFELIEKWKIYIRQKGIQVIDLPSEIYMEQNYYIGIGASDSTTTTAQFYYGGTPKYEVGFHTISLSDNTFNFPLANNTNLNVGFIERGNKKNKLENKTISIQGDSITTFEGTITDGNSFYYSSTHQLVNTKDATWWGILVKECRMKLLCNDAWSGSRISGAETTASTMSNNARCAKLYNSNSTPTYPIGMPEIILCMCGTNDISGNIAMGSIGDNNQNTYLGAFSLMCQRMKTRYSNSKIVFFQLPRSSVYLYKNTTTYQYQYLEEMRKCAEAHDCYFIPQSYFNLNATNMSVGTCGTQLGTGAGVIGDYLHPNAQGMECVYSGVRSFLETLF